MSFYDEVNGVWELYDTPTASNWPFVFDQTNQNFRVRSNDPAYELLTEVKVKIEVESFTSEVLPDRLITNEFTLTLRHRCAYNSLLTLTTNVNSFTYVIDGTNSPTKLPVFTKSEAVCNPTAELQFYDETGNRWIVYNPATPGLYSFVDSFSTTTGALIVNTNVKATYAPAG